MSKEYRGLWRYVVIFVIVFILSFLNLFGIRQSLQSYSDRIAQNILAAWHRDKFTQSKITVVLIDQKFRDKFERLVNDKMIWPLPVNIFLNKLINPISLSAPEGIFIDLSFPDGPRQTIYDQPGSWKDSLKELAHGLVDISRENSVSIFVGDTITPNVDSEACSSKRTISEADIAKCGLLSKIFIDAAFPPTVGDSKTVLAPSFNVVVAGWNGSSETYPLAILEVEPEGDGPRVSRKYLVSPALALFATMCGKEDDFKARSQIYALCREVGAAGRVRSGQMYYNLDSTLLEPVAVEWGSHLSRTMRKHFAAVDPWECNPCSAQYYHTRIWESITIFANQIIPNFRKWLGMPVIARHCAYIDTISAADLDDPVIQSDFIKNRVVLVGTQLSNVKDTVLSPVNEEVPGVYLHAAALENLLFYGANYKHPPDDQKEIFVIIIEAMFVAIMTFVYDRWIDPENTRWRTTLWIRVPAVLGLSFFLVTCLAIFLRQAWNFPFANILFVTAMILIELYERLREDVQKAMEKNVDAMAKKVARVGRACKVARFRSWVVARPFGDGGHAANETPPRAVDENPG